MQEIAEAIGLNEVYEEYYIGDYEGPLKIYEYEYIDDLNRIAKKAEYLNGDQFEAACALYEHGCTTTVLEAIQKINNNEDVILHYYDSMEEIAESIYNECYNLESFPLVNYIDWRAVARDLELEGTFIKVI